MALDTGLLETPGRGISRAEEKQIAKALSPEIAWPTLVLAAALPASFVAIAALGFTGGLPPWACTVILTFVSYAHYTLVHESIHGNVITRKGFGWVNTVVGWTGALGLAFAWPVMQKTHVLHHSHTNTERDPDITVKGTFGQLLLKWLRNSVMGLIPLFAMKYVDRARYQRLAAIFTPADIAQSSTVTLLTLGLLVAGLATGHVLEWLCLWYAPTRLGLLILNIFFRGCRTTRSTARTATAIRGSACGPAAPS